LQDLLCSILTIQHALWNEKKVERSKSTCSDSEAAHEHCAPDPGWYTVAELADSDHE
jgi:hypothetical protein